MTDLRAGPGAIRGGQSHHRRHSSRVVLPSNDFQPHCTFFLLTSNLFLVADVKPFRINRFKKTRKIRVLMFDTDLDTADVRVYIENVLLDEPHLHYDALSYAWGNSKDQIPISCGEFELLVMPNLVKALESIRKHPNTRPYCLRIDAICIYSNRSRIKTSET